MNGSHSQFVRGGVAVEYEPLLREMIAVEAYCPLCYPFERIEYGRATINGIPPSPLHWSRQIEYPWAILESGITRWRGEKLWPNLLDIGAACTFSRFLSQYGEVTALGNDPEWKKHLDQSTKSPCCRKGTIKSGVVRVVSGDARKLDFFDTSFDVVFFLSVLEHIPDKHSQSVREAIRVLRPGGILLLSMDVVIQGEAGNDNNFYVTPQIAMKILHEFKIPFPEPGSDAQAISAQMGKENLRVVTLLVKYVKDKE